MEMKIIENFFTQDDITLIKKHCEEVKDRCILDAKKMWSKKLTLGRGNVDIYELKKSNDRDVWHLIHQTMCDKFDMQPRHILFHYWQPESFISWHDDNGHLAAATVYLNIEWHRDNGGIFLYQEDSDDLVLGKTNIRAEFPEYNKCIFQKGGLHHSTTATHWKSPTRKSLQVFF